MRAARYLGVPLWELEERSVEYRDMAILAMGLDAEHERYVQRQTDIAARRRAAR